MSEREFVLGDRVMYGPDPESSYNGRIGTILRRVDDRGRCVDGEDRYAVLYDGDHSPITPIARLLSAVKAPKPSAPDDAPSKTITRHIATASLEPGDVAGPWVDRRPIWASIVRQFATAATAARLFATDPRIKAIVDRVSENRGPEARAEAVKAAWRKAGVDMEENRKSVERDCRLAAIDRATEMDALT